MKVFSKILTVIITTVGAVGTAGGAVMLGVGGGSQTIKMHNVADGSTTTQGVGWLNYSSIAGQLLSSTISGNPSTDISNLISYTDLLDQIKKIPVEVIDETRKQLTSMEDQLQQAKDRFNTASEFEKPAIQQFITQAEISISMSSAVVNAVPMFNLAIAGIAIMGVGILVAILSAFMAMRVESSEEKKIAKKNKANAV